MKSLGFVLVAAGSSQRFRAHPSSGGSSKLLIQWDGKPLFIHSLEAIQKLGVSDVVMATRLSDQGFMRQELAKSSQLSELNISFVEGGARRQDSVRNGLRALKKNTKAEFAAIHDCARPFLSESLMQRIQDRLSESVGVIPVLRITETVKQIDKDSRVIKTLKREEVVRVQTPQVFKLDQILEAHDQLVDSEQLFTDDASLLEFLGKEVRVVEGDTRNIKITTPEDLMELGIDWRAHERRAV